MAYSDRVVRAFAMAHALHADQRRKGSDAPYITHLMAVASLVGQHGGDEDTIIAALLHDAVEDQGGAETLARIEAEFGADVAALVDAATDAGTHPKPPWRTRKEAHLARLVNAPAAVRLLVAADKLHNARDLAYSLRQHGEAVWPHFKGGREGTLWYYGEMLHILGDAWLHPILDELRHAVELLQEAATREAPAET
jgi:(p)ppGpp synthase/HD superfamily hydrolase